MKIQFTPTSWLLCLVSAVFAVTSCSKKKLNESLFEETSASGLTYYQGKDSILSAAGGSPHGSFKLRFNSVASEQFGADGKFPAGSAFKEGSLIVKEVYSGGKLNLYAVMKKQNSKFAAGGWLWAEYTPEGKAVYSVAKKGKTCVACHSATPNRDLTRSFDLH